MEAFPESRKSRDLKADPKRMIKSFSRSSAGAGAATAQNLRPSKVLLRTVNYLMSVILPTAENEYPFHLLYDFIFDRLRAVRQDIIIQQISGVEKIMMYERMILFHAYAHYRLSEVGFRLFDPVINKQHLSECITNLMVLYDEEDEYFMNPDRYDNGVFSETTPVEVRGIFEAAYILHNLLDSQVSLTRKVPKKIIDNRHLQDAFKIGTCFLNKNYFTILKMMPRLNLFNAFILSQHVPTLHLRYLRILNSACSAHQGSVPLKYLAKVLCPFEAQSTAESYVASILEVLKCDIEGKSVRFKKSNTKFQAPEKEILSEITKRRWSELETKYNHEDMGRLTDRNEWIMCTPSLSQEISDADA
jgi:SAC3 domain-containing protein 1